MTKEWSTMRSNITERIARRACSSHHKKARNSRRNRPPPVSATEPFAHRRDSASISWHTQSGYSKRAKVETTFSRYKQIFGPAMRARRLVSQRVEARIACKILNQMTAFGMPDGQMLG